MLKSYKHASQSARPPLAQIVHDFLLAHSRRVAAHLGGAPSVLVPVPSTRGVPADRQPLLEVARLAERLSTSMPTAVAALEHTGVAKQRMTYQADLFRPRAGISIAGHHVVILEDSWTSGSAALSAAAAAVSAGASSAVVLAIARLFNESFWSQFDEGRAYAAAMNQPWSVTQWPR